MAVLRSRLGVLACVTVILLPSAACQHKVSTSALPACGEQTIVAYLEGKYDEFIAEGNGYYTITGLSYIHEWAALEPISNPALARLFPTTRFYKTAVQSGNFEYMQVETLVSIRPVHDQCDARSILSPVFGEPSGKFMQQFVGIPVSDTERTSVTAALTELLSAITYGGSVRAVQCDVRSCSAELWHSQLHWRNVTVTFNSNGAIDNVALFNPKA